MKQIARDTGAGTAAALLCALSVTCAAAAAPRGDVLIDGKGVHPESITSTADGTLFTGSMSGVIYRARPADPAATAFIRPDAKNGLQAVFGVLADEKAGRLWACSVANPFARPAAQPAAPAELVAFGLRDGRLIGRWQFPAPGGVCNDVAVARDGAVYAADTPNGRILKLARGARALTVAAEADALKGIDGLSFAGDGTLYVNIVTRGELLRVELPRGGKALAITKLKLTRPLAGPDGFRSVGGNRFLLAEGTGGRIDLVTIDWDIATIRVLKSGLDSTPNVTAVGRTAYAVETRIGYLIDPKLRGQDPGPFKLIAIPFE